MESFQKDFTSQQKAAIICSMTIITKTSDGISNIEFNYIEQIAETLGITLNNPELITIMQGGRANLALILNTLSQSNKEWYAVAIKGLLSQKGQPEEKKLHIALTILSDIGITEYEFVALAKQAEAIYQAVNKFPQQ